MHRNIALLLFFLPVAVCGQSPGRISDYKPILATARSGGQEILLLRSFKQVDIPYYLVVDMGNMTTSAIPAIGVKAKSSNWEQIWATYSNSPYVKALADAGRMNVSLQDAGIAHGYPMDKGITLTIDLCPSQRPLDRDIFTSLISGLRYIEEPVPVGISLSGKFLLNHTADINWLLEMVKEKHLSITWINHSYNHYYKPGLPLYENFLLRPNTNLAEEVLGNEKAMLEHGIVPSIFFRFPGLVSDSSLINKVLAYGLVPIGSDAWLAKGQHASKGSIVMIHGNGNEPLGVADFLKLLRNNQQAIRQKQWLLFDLRSSIDEEEGN